MNMNMIGPLSNGPVGSLSPRPFSAPTLMEAPLCRLSIICIRICHLLASNVTILKLSTIPPNFFQVRHMPRAPSFPLVRRPLARLHSLIRTMSADCSNEPLLARARYRLPLCMNKACLLVLNPIRIRTNQNAWVLRRRSAEDKPLAVPVSMLFRDFIYYFIILLLFLNFIRISYYLPFFCPLRQSFRGFVPA